MNNLHPIKLLPAREQVASALRKVILSREIKEGEEIILESIAKKLGVSTTPVREALQILSRDGLIKLRPNKGAVVLGVNEKMIRDHYETRAILESEAVAMVCRNESDITEILNAHKQGIELLESGNVKDYGNLNQAFHMSIWSAAGNSKIKSLLASMWNGLSLAENVTEESYAEKSVSEHEEIVKKIIARDEKKAKELMNKHIIRSMNDILTHFH